jgi:hypothetical protein
MARQVCALQVADITVVKNCRSVVLLERETTALGSIVSGDYGNASGKQAMGEAAGAAEKIDGDGAAGRSIFRNGAVSRSLASHSKSKWY